MADGPELEWRQRRDPPQNLGQSRQKDSTKANNCAKMSERLSWRPGPLTTTPPITPPIQQEIMTPFLPKRDSTVPQPTLPVPQVEQMAQPKAMESVNSGSKTRSSAASGSVTGEVIRQESDKELGENARYNTLLETLHSKRFGAVKVEESKPTGADTGGGKGDDSAASLERDLEVCPTASVVIVAAPAVAAATTNGCPGQNAPRAAHPAPASRSGGDCDGDEDDDSQMNGNWVHVEKPQAVDDKVNMDKLVDDQWELLVV